MDYINPPAESPQHVTHKTFYSRLFDHELGYNIYLPPDYEDGDEKYPVAYHLHGWTGSESSHIWTLEHVYKSRRAITVFPNNSPVIEDRENLPVEAMFTGELIPHIDGGYRTDAARESRSVSGMSMRGGAALYYAVKYPELFSSVTAYAGTFHHYIHPDYCGREGAIGAPMEKAAGIYENIMKEAKYFEENGIFYVIKQNADKIRGKLHIQLHIGTADIICCDSAVLHLYLDSLDIPHEYKIFEGIGHELDKIL